MKFPTLPEMLKSLLSRIIASIKALNVHKSHCITNRGQSYNHLLPRWDIVFYTNVEILLQAIGSYSAAYWWVLENHGSVANLSQEAKGNHRRP